MMRGGRFRTVTVAALVALMWMAGQAGAAPCGSTAAGFEAWKTQFAAEARGKGVGASTIAALMSTPYARATIAADRGQRSFRLSLDQFLAKRGGSVIVARGRALKQSQAALFASIQQRYGVPSGPLLAIWGMETGFGRERGNQNTLSADLDGKFPQGPWLARGRGISAGRSQFRSDPGVECCFGLSAGHRASWPTD
jgi:membrane-bound lytic murein transglycosylase B